MTCHGNLACQKKRCINILRTKMTWSTKPFYSISKTRSLIVKRLEDQKSDPITFMLNITDSVSSKRRQINPGVLFDLKKYFKPAWDKLNDFKTNYIFQNVLNNLETGKSKGYYHKDINEKLIARLYVHLIDFF